MGHERLFDEEPTRLGAIACINDPLGMPPSGLSVGTLIASLEGLNPEDLPGVSRGDGRLAGVARMTTDTPLRARRQFGLLALVLLGGLLASCSNSAGTNAADASAAVDAVADNDLANDLGEVPADDAVDASVDAPIDVGVDRPDAVDVPPAMHADVRGVDLGGIFVPVDPDAVPAPGSECTSDASVRAGDPTVSPPRPIRPLSVSRVTSQRPTFQWVLPDGTTGARIEVCADRCCTRVLQTIDAEGTTVRPTTALPPGVVFWRMFGRRGTVVGSRASYTWEFGVRRRDAPNDTTWGTIRDFNGDGFDDLIVFRAQDPPREPTDLLLMPGSAEGLRAPITTGVVATRLNNRAQIGDFNGDGLADIAWDDRIESVSSIRSWFSVALGSRDRIRSSMQPDVSVLGSCAVTGDSAAVDWNGDGYSDLIIGVGFGCDSLAPTTASVLLGFHGSHTGIAPIPQWALRVDGLFPHSLVAVTAGLGDLDNDGYGDISVVSDFSGAGTTSTPAQHAFFHGVSSGEPRMEPLPEPTPRPDPSGWGRGRLRPIGDVDGDGYLDILMSLNYSNPIYVYRHATGLGAPSARLTDPLNGANFGFHLSAGDVNGDGLADAVISSQRASDMQRDGVPIHVGRVYVFAGSNGGALPQPISIARPRSESEEVPREIFGSQPTSPGDINGDGFDDLTMSDTLESRLCVRYGGLAFASGPPDRCIDDVMPWESVSY